MSQLLIYNVAQRNDDNAEDGVAYLVAVLSRSHAHVVNSLQVSKAMRGVYSIHLYYRRMQLL